MFYKTWLFVPSIEKYLNSIPKADVIIFDLEDSIRAEDKSEARDRLKRWILNNKNNRTQEFFVRINSDREGQKDLEALHDCDFNGVMIPKFEDPFEIYRFVPYLERRKVIALVETVSGVIAIDTIAACEDIDIIAFGGEDFCRDLGVETNDQAMQYARGRIVLYSKYYHKCCLDSISLVYKDKERFRKQFENSLSLGFDSRLLIHPSQVKVVESLDSQINLEKIRSIVGEYEKSNTGLTYINGRWYEKPHIERLKELLQTQGESKDA